MIAVTAGEVRASLWRHLRAPVMSAELWLATAFVTIGTNLLDFATVPVPGTAPGAAFIAAAIVRVGLVFWIGYVLARRMAQWPNPWAIRPSFARYFLFGIVMAAAFAILVKLAGLAQPAEPSLASEWLAMLVAVAIWSALTIKLIAWNTALALDAPFRALPGIWRDLRGAGVALAMVFLQVILPFAAIHYALTLVGLRLALSGTALAALAAVDGVISAIQLVLTVALSVVAWRIARAAPGLQVGPAPR